MNKNPSIMGRTSAKYDTILMYIEHIRVDGFGPVGGTGQFKLTWYLDDNNFMDVVTHTSTETILINAPEAPIIAHIEFNENGTCTFVEEHEIKDCERFKAANASVADLICERQNIPQKRDDARFDFFVKMLANRLDKVNW